MKYYKKRIPKKEIKNYLDILKELKNSLENKADEKNEFQKNNKK